MEESKKESAKKALQTQIEKLKKDNADIAQILDFVIYVCDIIMNKGIAEKYLQLDDEQRIIYEWVKINMDEELTKSYIEKIKVLKDILDISNEYEYTFNPTLGINEKKEQFLKSKLLNFQPLVLDDNRINKLQELIRRSDNESGFMKYILETGERNIMPKICKIGVRYTIPEEMKYNPSNDHWESFVDIYYQAVMNYLCQRFEEHCLARTQQNKVYNVQLSQINQCLEDLCLNDKYILLTSKKIAKKIGSTIPLSICLKSDKILIFKRDMCPSVGIVADKDEEDFYQTKYHLINGSSTYLWYDKATNSLKLGKYMHVYDKPGASCVVINIDSKAMDISEYKIKRIQELL